MAVAIINLDELLGEDKIVEAAGKKYRLPPDLPVELYLRITRAATEQMTDLQMIELLHDELLELFRYGDPEIDRLPFGVQQIVEVIPRVYGAQPEGEERPTTPKTRGASGAPKRRPSSKSRS